MADLAVAYRIYPGISRTPAVHASDKFELARLCLDSFVRASRHLRLKLWVLLDNCPVRYETLFLERFRPQELELVRLSGVGNQATFRLQLDTLLRQTDSERVYFAEDDFFYLPQAFDRMLAMQAEPDAHFVTAYDHLEYYQWMLHRYPVVVRQVGGQHWRQSSNTCLTFMSTRTTLRRAERVLRSYATGSLDHSMWLSLTRRRILNPWFCVQARLSHDWEREVVRDALLRNWPQILAGPRFNLWSPMPALATHLESSALSPGIDWPARFAEVDGDEKSVP